MYVTWGVWGRERGREGWRSGENECAICQCGNTSKSHWNARSPCSAGRIKPSCECVRAPCIARWVYNLTHTHTWKVLTSWMPPPPQLSTTVSSNASDFFVRVQQYLCFLFFSGLFLLFDDYSFNKASEGGRMRCLLKLVSVWFCAVLYVAGTLSHAEVGGRMMKRKGVKNLFRLYKYFTRMGAMYKRMTTHRSEKSLPQCSATPVGTTCWALLCRVNDVSQSLLKGLNLAPTQTWTEALPLHLSQYILAIAEPWKIGEWHSLWDADSAGM